MLSGSLPPNLRARGVTAVLGPTNTGKTHLAIERMLGHSSGLIGLPLRLLAREVYNRVVDRVGKDKVALITGEEKIKPKHARYWIATVEAMPRDLDVAFLAIDEIQLAADSDRGHVFTNAMLNMRGREETLIIGSSTMKPLVERLLPGANIISRPRLSKLSFAGERKITRLPPRSAIVAFSAEEVYAIAELIRRQRGGAAVVMGALSPRTRNAQVELFQNGDVDHIVATDAIGMGLNLEIDHVAFAADRKFDGYHHRRLTPAEMAQIAGRAGRHLKDGTFGTSARCAPFEQELVEQLEGHDFDAVRVINWRNPDLQFSSLKALQASLQVPPQEQGVTSAPTAADEITLEIAASRPDIRDLASTPAAVRRLWEVCALPDYRKVAHHHHADLAISIYEFLMRGEFIPVDWFAAQIALCNKPEGEIDTLSARLAQIRTWTFCANRVDWLRDPEHWQRVTRKVEDNLSDALHEKLAARFVDRRTSVLMRRLRENSMLEAEVTTNGDVLVEGQTVGKLSGFRFTADTQGMGVDTPEAKAMRAVAAKSLASEIEARATRFSAAEDGSFALALDGTIRWLGEPVAKLQAGEKTLEPRFIILADEHLSGPPREQVEARLTLWLKAHVAKYLGPLLTLEAGETLTGIGRGLGYQLAENLGVLERAGVANDVKSLDQPGRAELRKLGVRFGSYHIYTPQLMKPAARALAAQLWMLKHGGLEPKGLDDIVHLSSSGRTSFPADETLPKGLYRAAGFRVCGPRAVRIDILERLADLIRPAIAFKPGITPGAPPAGATEGDGFTVSVAMTSLVGCSGEDFAAILKSLGYRSEKKPLPEPKPIVPLPGSEAMKASAEEPQAATIEEPAPEIEPSGEQAESPTEAISTPAEEAAEPLAAAEVEHSIPAEEQIEPPPASEEPTDNTSHAERAVEAVVEGEDASATQQTEGADTPESADTPASAEPAEPVMIEVWRAARFDRGDHQRKSRNRDKADKPKLGRQLWVRDPNKPAAPAEAAKDGEAAPRTLWTRDPAKPVRQDRPGGDRLGGERPGAAGKRQNGGRPHSDDRRGNERGGNRFAEGRNSGQSFSQTPKQERQADPDSPFAKLAALKAQLEGKS
ncbi:MAG: helicase [Beijerinckiaceae bacterium]|nr:helicase [Beijerinckiaceae bacterium]